MYRLPVEQAHWCLLIMTADRTSQMNYEAYRATLSAHILRYAIKPIARRVTVQMDNDHKHTMKATQDLMKAKILNILQWPKQSKSKVLISVLI